MLKTRWTFRAIFHHFVPLISCDTPSPQQRAFKEILAANFAHYYRFCVSSHHRHRAMTSSGSVLGWDAYYEKNKDRLVQLRLESPSEKRIVLPDINRRVAMWQGDITKLEIDAIVNAANSSLMGGGGVDGAIHRAAGPKLKQECVTLNGCKVGEAKITNGYNLTAKHVIHTVGPQGEKPDLLKSCYNSCLDIMIKKNLHTIAFPCISTGIYGYPQEPAAHIALSTVRSFLEKNPDKLNQVIFCLFLPQDVKIYETLLQVYFPMQ